MKALALLALVIAMAGTAHADTTGIRFNRMPVGCRIHGTYASGERVIDEYAGMSGSKHVVKTYGGAKGKTFFRTTLYSAKGLMLRKDWANGKWESYAPASGFDVPGNCTYTYRNADGAKKTYKGKTRKTGNRLVSTGGFVGEAPFQPTTSTLGRFNNGAAFAEGDTSFRVTKYENCGIDS
ncbi:MAG: hypothetical protein WAT09_15485 [Paracoccaceae bacterium]